jgi:hypothetical protein
MVGIQTIGETVAFEAPGSLTLSNNPSEISIQWEPVEGAFFYETQISGDSSFSAPQVRTVTERTSVRVPVEASNPNTLFVRVRAAERSSLNGSTTDSLGAWSGTRSLSVPANPTRTQSTAPQPTSPVDGFESFGFSIALEWAGATPVRLQMSRNANFQNTFVDQIVDGNEFTPASSALHTGERFYWRLQSWGSRMSEWSTARYFDVTEPRAASDDSFVNPEAPR